jgi:putative transposase
MTVFLNRDYGIKINRKRTRRYMRQMGIHGFCPGPNLSKQLHGKYLYPYLLRGLNIDHPDQVWSVDITYCRMNHGFMYMVAIIDSCKRKLIASAVKAFCGINGSPEYLSLSPTLFRGLCR